MLGAPRHPYTRHLVEIARGDAPLEARTQPTELPDPFNQPTGCRYRSRCPLAVAECAALQPELRVLGAGHSVACHLATAMPAAATPTPGPRAALAT